MAKSRDAFRTISEVSDALDTPTHVLRFWESKFTQIKPVKRAGGRRYYRPEDIDLLAGIKILLHDHGLTIKGAQKLLREQGVKHVMALGDAGAAEGAAAQEPATDVAAEDTVVAATPSDDAAPTQIIPSADVTPAPVESPKVPAEAVKKTRPRPTILAEVAAPNQLMVAANAAKIAPLLARLATLRDAMRAA